MERMRNRRCISNVKDEQNPRSWNFWFFSRRGDDAKFTLLLIWPEKDFLASALGFVPGLLLCLWVVIILGLLRMFVYCVSLFLSSCFSSASFVSLVAPLGMGLPRTLCTHVWVVDCAFSFIFFYLGRVCLSCSTQG
jgi:hypothetical protein